MGFFLPKQWRLQKVLYALLVLELPFTVANLTLFGIASPNLYRTILWKEGGRMGFNSDPSTVLYAAANYKPVKTPVVWSSFNTQYNMYIGVVTMFFWLIKATTSLMHCFYPILALILHIALLAIWSVSVHVQTAPDTIDPKRENHGAPWYITKNCNIEPDHQIRRYCVQAKSSFAISCCMLGLMVGYLVLAGYSLIPTSSARIAHEHKLAEKRAEKELYQSSPYDNEMTSEQQWQYMWELQQLPRTPGTHGGLKSPVTPRTRAFGALEGDVERQTVGAGGYYNQEEIQRLPKGYQPGQLDEYVPDQKGKGAAY